MRRRALAAALTGALVASGWLLAGSVEAQAAPTDRALKGRIGALERQLDRQAARVYRHAAGHGEVQRRHTLAQQQLASHAVELYKTGDRSALSVLASASDVNQAIDALVLTERILRYDRELLADLERAGEDAAVAQDQYDVAVAQLVATSSELDQVRERLAGRIARRTAAAERQRAAAQAAAARAEAAAQLASNLTPLAGAGAGSSLFSQFSPGALATRASASQIDAYLRQKGSPMAGTGVFFMVSGSRWNIDPRLVVAIAGAESSFGQQTCGPFNAWGWACPNNPARFDSWADGIDTVAKGLRRYYLDEGRTSVVEIHRKYAPVGAANDPTGLNNHWVKNVSKFLLEQGGNPNDVRGTAG